MADMANYWAMQGVHVVLATWSDPGTRDFYPLDKNVRRVYLEAGAEDWSMLSTTRSVLRRICRLRSLFIEVRPNAALSFLTQNNILSILASVGLGLRLVISERAPPAIDSTVSPVWQLLRKICYSWSSDIVAQTWEVARWVRQNCRKEAHVIPNALRPMPTIGEVRQHLIVGIGRLEIVKGFDLLLRAFAKVASEFPEWTVAIIGEGSERDNLLQLRDELCLTNSVNFLGQVRDVELWMARAGLVVQPSRFEGFPNVVLEAMGMGAAVVSADCSAGPADLIDDGTNGRLVPAEDVDALAMAMAELLSQPEVRTRLGREALKVRQRFHQDLIMSKWEACLFPKPEIREPALDLHE